MSEPEQSAEPPPTKPTPNDAPSKGDFLALGIGCLVLVLFFAAIVIVGITRE